MRANIPFFAFQGIGLTERLTTIPMPTWFAEMVFVAVWTTSPSSLAPAWAVFWFGRPMVFQYLERLSDDGTRSRWSGT